jgi:ABC-type cobalamin/Fe3+-siderophores transport system ATPase subunit
LVVAEGGPGEVLSAENLSAHYGASVRVLEEDGVVFVVPTRR